MKTLHEYKRVSALTGAATIWVEHGVDGVPGAWNPTGRTVPMTSFSDDFLQGQKDCKAGVAHEEGKSEAYDRGYSTQYTFEQIQTELSR